MEPATQTAERESPEPKDEKQGTPLPSDRLSAISRRVQRLELQEHAQESSPWSKASLGAAFAVSLVSSLVLYGLYWAWTKLRGNP